MDFKYYMLPEVQWSVEQHLADGKEREKLMLEFKLEGVAPGDYRFSASEISPTKGSILNEWKKMEFETRLRKEEMEYLKSVCVPRLSGYKIKVKEDSLLSLSIELEPQEIAFLKIYRV
jgi:beta-xylosidase